MEKDVYLAVYNPGMGDSQLLRLYLNTSMVEVSAWFPYTRSYLPVTAEAFCYPNLDTQTGQECEVNVRHKITSLSLSILRIRLLPSSDISVKPSSNLSLSNDRVTLTLDTKSIGSPSVNFTIQNSLGTKHVTFDFRYYLNYYMKRNDDEHDGGLYIFKSTINDSLPFNHTVANATAYHGSLSHMILITYASEMNPYQQTSVRLRLP